MKRILIMAGSFTTGGVEAVLLNLLRNIDFRRYSIDIIVLRDYEGPYDVELCKLGVRIIKHKTIGELGIIKYYQSICLIIRNGNYDVIHINGVLSSAINILAAKNCKVKNRIFHAHNTKDYFINRINMKNLRKVVEGIFRIIINHCSTIKIACGNDAAVFVFGKSHKDEVQIIHNAVDLEKFALISSNDHNEKKEILRKYNKKIVVGSAARFTDVKNQEFAIKVIEAYVKNVSDEIALLLAGEGPERKRCEKYVEEHNLSEYVCFLGNIDEMEKFYKCIDVFILPSKFEGLPVCAIEAQACGIPILMSDCITKEADLDIGLTYYISLNELDTWVSTLGKAFEKRIYSGKHDAYDKAVSTYSLDKLIHDITTIYEI